MPLKVIKTEKINEEDLQRFKEDQEDLKCLVRNAQKIEEQFRGRYIAVVNKEVFVGESFINALF